MYIFVVVWLTPASAWPGILLVIRMHNFTQLRFIIRGFQLMRQLDQQLNCLKVLITLNRTEN